MGSLSWDWLIVVEKEHGRYVIQILKALKHHGISGDKTTRTD
jgi:hypothetical protein